MPRKTDGIIYELHPRPTRDEDGKPLLYAQPVIDKKYSIKELDEFCAKYRGKNLHEVESALLCPCLPKAPSLPATSSRGGSYALTGRQLCAHGPAAMSS